MKERNRALNSLSLSFSFPGQSTAVFYSAVRGGLSTRKLKLPRHCRTTHPPDSTGNSRHVSAIHHVTVRDLLRGRLEPSVNIVYDNLRDILGSPCGACTQLFSHLFDKDDAPYLSQALSGPSSKSHGQVLTWDPSPHLFHWGVCVCVGGCGGLSGDHEAQSA